MSLPSERNTSAAGLFGQLLAHYVPTSCEQHLDGGMAESPLRMAKAWDEWTSGYREDPHQYIKTFQSPVDLDQMITVANLPVFSLCEHHGAPFFGVAHVGYIPDGRILGLSKFARIVNAFSRRFQVQERLTVQVADLLWASELEPAGVAVQFRCLHSCMSSRGVRAHGASTTTTALRGMFRQDDSAKDEFLRFCASASAANPVSL